MYRLKKLMQSTDVLPRYMATYSILFTDQRIAVEGTAELTRHKVRMREMKRVTNLTKRQKETALVVLSVLLFISLAAYSYFILYVPVKETNEQMKLMTSNERDVLFALRKQSAAKGQTDTTSSQPLQRKVPSMPLEDAVLLQIGKAEIKSGSIVQDIHICAR